MKNTYSYHRDYAHALTTGNVPALKKLIRRALRARPQKQFFTGDAKGRVTHFEELATAVWRTFESGHVEHGRLFLRAGLPVDILLPDVDGITMEVLWTPLDVTLFPGDQGDPRGKLALTKMLLAAGANPSRKIWPHDGPESWTPSYVRTLEAARALWEYGVPAEAFVSLPAHLRARL